MHFYAKHLGLYITQECLENPDVPPMIYCRASHCVWQDGKWVPLEQMPAAQDPDTRFHTGHLEEFPELTGWLCKCFDDFYDANLSHNDLIELTLNHLQRESLKPEFFISLAENAPAVCMGTKKNMEECGLNCGQYHRCSNIAGANDRSRQWETLASLLTMHKNGSCSCNEEAAEECPAAKYLKGAWDISEFFHSEDRKEAA